MDSWSAGAVLFRLLKGGLPFLKNSDKLKWAYESEVEIRLQSGNHWSKDMFDFVMSLLNKDPKFRPTSK